MAQNIEIEWYRSLDGDTEYLTEEAKIGFAVCLERRLVQRDMSKADLARRLGTSSAYITKILRGDSNLTIKTMVELAEAVESTLHLHIAPRQHDVRWLEIIQGVADETESAGESDAASVWARQTSRGVDGYAPFAA